MHDNIAIKVKNLTKVYHLYDNPKDRLKEALSPFKKKYHHDFYALNDVSFEIKKGETVGIIGKNGAGKSTLLKMITGVLTPTSGEVEVTGKIASLLELGAGFNPEMTGMENIYLNGTIMGFTHEEMEKKIDAIREFADIGEFIHQPVKMYSSGMFARLAFSVAINVEPDVLIVDEALSVGDMAFQMKCISKFQDLKEIGTTILFVTHSMNQILAFCKYVVWINDGKVLLQGIDVETIVKKYENYLVHKINPFEVVENKEKNVSQVSFKNDFNWYNITQDDRQEGGIDAQILAIKFLTENGDNIISKWNEKVKIEILIKTYKYIKLPLIGMGLKNHLGEYIVHFNTTSVQKTLDAFSSNTIYKLGFEFVLPNLSEQKYIFSLGLDKGQLGNHSLVHHIYDVLEINVIRNQSLHKQSGYVMIDSTTLNVVLEKIDDV